MLYIYILVFITGTVLASFIHVYVTRLIKGESIIAPRSHCTNCNHVLSWYELIPVISYLALKGRCSKCNSKIGIDSFLSEIFTGLAFLLVFIIYGFNYDTLLGFLIVLVLLSIFLSDFKEMIILDSTIIVGILLEYLIIYLDGGLRSVYHSFMYGVFAFVLMFLIKILGDAIFKRESLGGGDIKLTFFMGSILPYNLFLISTMIGSSIALPYALYIAYTKKRSELAFGPFLALGLLVVFLLKNDIIKLLELIIK